MSKPPREKLIPIHIDSWSEELVDPVTGSKVRVKYLADYEGFAITEDAQLISPYRRKWTRGAVNNMGAPQVTVRPGPREKGTKLLLARIVATAWVPQKDPKATFIDHLDNNRANNQPSNLEWVTHEENMRRRLALYLKVPKFRAFLKEHGRKLGNKYGHTHTGCRFITDGVTRRRLMWNQKLPKGWTPVRVSQRALKRRAQVLAEIRKKAT